MTTKVKNVMNVVVLNLNNGNREIANIDKPASAGKVKSYVGILISAFVPFIIKWAFNLLTSSDVDMNT